MKQSAPMFAAAMAVFLTETTKQSITIPLTEVATATVEPTTTDTTTGTITDTITATTDKAKKTNALIEFCAVARSRAEMMEFMRLANANHFRKEYLNPLLKSGILLRTIPDKPNSRNQKYVKASKP